MKRKLILVGLILMLLTGAILFGSLAYVAITVLPGGSIEEFAALKGWDDSVIYRDQEKRYYGGGELSAETYVKELEEDSLLRKQLGGVQWVENGTEKYALYYVTEPSQQLRDQLQQEDAFQFMEVALAKCEYSLLQLGEALNALDAYLPTAPASVRDSIQVSLLSPQENRIAVYVQDWSVFDQLSLARAMGPMCPMLYLVEENLDETMPQMEFIHYDSWMTEGKLWDWAVPEHGGTKEPIPAEIAVPAGEKLSQIHAEYMLCMELSVGLQNWRVAGLEGGGYNSYGYYGCLQINSWMKMPTGWYHYGVRPSSLADDESYTFYEEWGTQQERLTKAIFHEMEDFEYPIVVVHSY